MFSLQKWPKQFKLCYVLQCEVIAHTVCFELGYIICDCREFYIGNGVWGFRRAEGTHQGQLMGGIRLRLGVCLVGRRYTSE